MGQAVGRAGGVLLGLGRRGHLRIVGAGRALLCGPPQVTEVDQALSRQVDTIARDRAWTGGATIAFSWAWGADSAAGKQLGALSRHRHTQLGEAAAASPRDDALWAGCYFKYNSCRYLSSARRI